MSLEPGAVGGGSAYEMEPRIPKGPQRPPGRQRAAKRPVLQGPGKGTGGREPEAEPPPRSRGRAFALKPWVAPLARR